MRPQLVTGPTPGALNVLPAIGVYAAIQREKGEPFGFPGGPSFVWEAADALLQTIPYRGSIPGRVPTDPTIYRLYEVIQTYGTTLKALIHEQFGDGIISGINFKLDINKVPDPEGGERAIITLNRKYSPAKPF
jgi:Cyanate lyase C-terminal domain